MKHKILMLFGLFCNIALQAQTGTFETSIDPDAGQGSNNGININIMLDGFIITGAKHLLFPHKCRQRCPNLYNSAVAAKTVWVAPPRYHIAPRWNFA